MGRFVLIVAAFGSAAAHAQFVVTLRDGLNGYSGTLDVTLQDGSGTYGNPDMSYDAIDDSMDGYPSPRSTVLRCDLSSIAPGTTIASAQLSFGVVNFSLSTFPIYELLRPWSAPSASWVRPLPGQTWAGPGATAVGIDRGGVVLATADATPPYPFTAAGVAAVQRWVNQPDANYGFALQNFNTSDALNVRHCDFGTPGSRPQLSVTPMGGSAITFRQGVAPDASYAGCSDTTLAGAPPLGGNANTWGLFVSGSSPVGSSLLVFDLSVLPRDATVTAAELRLFGLDNSTSGFTVYEALRPWGELSATWTTSDGVTPWTTPGANGASTDRGTAALGTGTVAMGANTYALNATGVMLVQEWIRGSRPNRGFLFANFAASNRAVWGDREETDPTRRPALVVTLSSPTWDGGLIFPVVDAGAPDAGVDGGPPDAGLTDAGSARDAGDDDGGAGGGSGGAGGSGGGAGGSAGSGGTAGGGAAGTGGGDAVAGGSGGSGEGGSGGGAPVDAVPYGLGCGCGGGSGGLGAALLLLLALLLRLRGEQGFAPGRLR